MFDKIYERVGICRTIYNEAQSEVFPWLMGRSIPELESGENNTLHTISGCAIYDMHKSVLQSRTGIG